MVPFGFMPNRGMPLNFAQFPYGFPFPGFLGRGCGVPNGGRGRGRNQANNRKHVHQLCGK